MKKRIEGIEPFSKFWFRSCFYHALLPIISYYKKDCLPIILNELYTFNRKEGKLWPVAKTLFDYKQLLSAQGLSEEKRRQSENIRELIIKNINDNIPFILAVNSYYLNFRNDTYLKDHVVHYVCIHGYDDEAGTIDIIDHKYMGSYMYEYKTVPFANFLRAAAEFFYPDIKTTSGITVHKDKRFKDNVFIYRLKDCSARPQIDLQLLYKKYGYYVSKSTQYIKKVINQMLIELNGGFDSVDWKYYKEFFLILSWQREAQKFIYIHYNENAVVEEITSFVNSARFIWGVLEKTIWKKQIAPESLEKLKSRLNMLINNQAKIGKRQNELFH